MTEQGLRFGIWAAVHGNRGALQDPEEPYDASWERNKALVLEAEALGYDATLVAQHTMNPYDSNLDQLEAWSASAALAALTSRRSQAGLAGLLARRLGVGGTGLGRSRRDDREHR